MLRLVKCHLSISLHSATPISSTACHICACVGFGLCVYKKHGHLLSKKKKSLEELEWIHGWENEMGCRGGNKDSLCWDGFLKNLLTGQLLFHMSSQSLLVPVYCPRMRWERELQLFIIIAVWSSPLDVSNDTLPNLFMNMFHQMRERRKMQNKEIAAVVVAWFLPNV